MPGERALKPTEAPESPQKNRLQQALDLITDEAVETLKKGRNARAYQRTEKLLAIARALRIESAQSVEDFLVEGCGGDPQQTRNLAWGGNGIVMNPIQYQGEVVGPYTGGTASGDMQREEKLAQLEALTSRSRRDEAEARLALIREFKELSDLDLSKQPNEIREGINLRLTEITERLSTTDTTVSVEDTEPEKETA